MIVSDFILKVKDDLQEKSEQWSVESLLLKLQEAYIDMQFDLPYFIARETLAIQEGKSEYDISRNFLRGVAFSLDGYSYKYTDMENIYLKDPTQKFYSYHSKRIILNQTPRKDTVANIVYKYEKELTDQNCYIEFPTNWHKTLRFLFMSKIHEKPTRNTKERDLSVHYLKLYERSVSQLKKDQKAREVGVTSSFQLI